MGVHTIRKGDTLSGIAKQYNTTVDELARLNNIANPNRIYAGKQLRLPTNTMTTLGGTGNSSTGGSGTTGGSSATGTTPTDTPFPNLINTSYTDTDQGKADLKGKTDAEFAYTGYGDPNWGSQELIPGISNEQLYKDWYNKALNRDPFSYNFNEDALYQQYKDKYIQQGKMAMADTIGQASAMTGGYGNSYAATVGNQAYQASLQNLNDIVPELYQMAYDRYNQEGADIRNNIALLMADKENYMQDWQVGYNKVKDVLDYANTNYYGNADIYNADRDTKNSLEQLAWENTFTKKDDARQDALLKMQQEEHDAKMKAYNTPVVDETGGGGGGYKVTVDDSGNLKVDKTSGGGSIPASIEKKASEFTNNTSLANYLDGLEASGAISPTQADQLFAQYADENEFATNDKGEKVAARYKDMIKSSSGWTVKNDGGINWFWGVDNNAIVVAPNGEQIRLDNLKDKLISEGMTKSQAKDAIKKLQKNLGI